MITSVTLENFKSIKNRTSLDLQPLTVFTGSNSSGKSTILQAILVLSQSSLHAGTDRQLVLNGSLTRLGQFQEIKNYFASSNSFTIGLSVRDLIAENDDDDSAYNYLRKITPTTSAELCCSFTDKPIDSRSAIEANSFPEILEMSTISYISGRSELFGPTSRKIAIRRHGWGADRRAKHEKIETDASGPYLDAMAWQVDLDDASLSELESTTTSSRVVGATFNHFLPRALVERVNLKEEYANYIIDSLVGKRGSHAQMVDDWVPAPELKEYFRRMASPQLASVFSDDKEQTMRSIKSALWKKADARSRRDYIRAVVDQRGDIAASFVKQEEPIYWLRTTSLPDKILDGQVLVRKILKNIRYVGPLRVQPSPLYPISNTLGSRDVGPSGEWTAAVLDEYKDALVPFVSPNGGGADTSSAEQNEVPLAYAVNEWIKYLEVAESVSTVDRGSLGHELYVTTGSGPTPLPLTQVGVGVSQCLPVVVSLLLAPMDSTTLLEQPELHLHPAVQSRLADFILSMTLSGRQCIVETHSEYFINKLRLKIASDEGTNLPNHVGVYFSEQGSDGSTYSQISINKYGKIDNWPKGFFDQSNNDMEALVLAALRKRKAHG